MNKRYLPAIASIFILAIAAVSFMPVFAANALRATSMPTLTVVTIPEDDEVRKTGVIILGMSPNPWWEAYPIGADFLAQFKVLVSYNGVPVAPSSFYCQVIEKDKANPLKDKQFYAENLKTVPKDQSDLFECKLRWAKPGVGVIDVYYIGPKTGQYIADYVLVVGFDYVIGRTTVYGTEMQDICVLGWPEIPGFGLPYPYWYVITKPDGTEHWAYTDPLGGFDSCEDIAYVQKVYLGLTVPWT